MGRWLAAFLTRLGHRLHVRRPSMARWLYAQALTCCPGHPLAEHALACLARQCGALDEARDRFVALAERPGEPAYRADSLLNLARIEHERGNIGEAAARYESVLEVRLDEARDYDRARLPAEAYCGLACIEREAGNAEQSRRYIELALEHCPRHPLALTYLAHDWCRRERPAQAVATAQRATHLDPGWAGSWSALGEAYHVAGERDQARNCFERAKALGDDEAALSLAIMIWQDGDKDAAQRRLLAIVTGRGEDRVRASALVYLGDVAGLQDRIEEARARYEAALAIRLDGALAPEGAQIAARAFLGLAYCASEFGDVQGSRELTARSLERWPDHAPALEYLALDLLARELPAEGMVAARRAVELDPTLRRSWGALGEAHRQMGRIDEARDCFERSAELGDEEAVAILAELEGAAHNDA